jgi:hypothetical protein
MGTEHERRARFGLRLRQLREPQTQGALVERVNDLLRAWDEPEISQSALSSWEVKGVRPKPTNLRALEQVFNLPTGYFSDILDGRPIRGGPQDGIDSMVDAELDRLRQILEDALSRLDVVQRLRR